MGISDRGEAMSTRIGRTRKCLSEGCSTGRCCARDVGRVHGIHHVSERSKNVVTPRKRVGKFGHEPSKRPHILHQFPHGRIHPRKHQTVELILQFVASSRKVAKRGWRECKTGSDVGVRCCLQIKIDRVRPRFDGEIVVIGLNRFQDATVWRISEALGLKTWKTRTEAEVNDDLHYGIRSTPVLGHAPRHMEPDGSPRTTPHASLGERCIFRLPRFGECDRLPRNDPSGYR